MSEKIEAVQRLARLILKAGTGRDTRALEFLRKHIEELEAAMQEFVGRCERGEVRSTYTLAKFRYLLGQNPSDMDKPESGG